MYQYRIILSLDRWNQTNEYIKQVATNRDIFIHSKSDDDDCHDYNELTERDKKVRSEIDWRYSSINLINLDMEKPQQDESQIITGGGDGSSGLGPLKSHYLGKGVVRLYRDMMNNAGNNEETSTQLPQDGNKIEETGTVMAILAVPSYFTPSDILGFVGSKYSEEKISHFRMIRTSVDNRYMVLIKFRTKDQAHLFYEEYNGKLFNSMEAESCQVVYIQSVEFNSHIKASDDDIPYLLEDDFTALTSTSSNNTTTKPSPPLPRSLHELPTCPVCLERMDTSVTGLLTILCQHTFHCQCLSKWGDGSCPVCRYSQRGNMRKFNGNPSELRCQICQTDVNLWMCVVCGRIGCGRYDQAHAFDHYVETGHCFSMDIGTQRVWDYANDGYVHRLIQNQSDGKLVELSQPGGSAAENNNAAVSNNNSGSADQKKMDEVGLQYTAILTSQLESQRLYYEDMFTSAADRAHEAMERAESAEKELESLKREMNQIKEERENELPKLRQDLANATEKAEKLKNMYQNLQQSYKDEKAMSQKMVDKLESVTKARTEQEQKVHDLEEQLRDLMFYLDAKDKLSNSGEDVQQGQVVMDSKGKGKKKR